MSYRRVSSNPSLLTKAQSGAAGTTISISSASVQPAKKSAKDFIFVKLIGEGSFSNVFHAVDALTGREYAIKVCDKRQIVREKKHEYIHRERVVMMQLNSLPDFVNLGCSFHDSRYLYFVMTLAKNGTLLQYLTYEKFFKLETARHYAAELLLACEQMHRRNIIHRDLKPENILLDGSMHIMIADFGSAKILSKEESCVIEEKKKTRSEQQKEESRCSKKWNSREREAFFASIPHGNKDYKSSSSSASSSSLDCQQLATCVGSGNSKSSVSSKPNTSDLNLKVPSLDTMPKSSSFNGSPSDPITTNDLPTLQADTSSVTNKPQAKDAIVGELENCSRYQRNRRQVHGSFVGTAQYVSPEVLQSETVTPMADLWAFGCIIYQMITGYTPFRGGKMFSIFKEIKACNVEFPNDFDAEAEDLIRKLLQTKASARLGADDEQGHYKSIRSHPFFFGVNFNTVRKQSVPRTDTKLPNELRNELPDNWREIEPGFDDKQLNRLCGIQFLCESEKQKEKANTLPFQKPPTKSSKESQIIHYFSLSPDERHQLLEDQSYDVWHQFVDNEYILKKGIVNKRKGLFPRKRMFLLTTGPRLIYIDPVPMVKKGEIPWTSELRVEAKNFKNFWVHTPNRIYYLEEPNGYGLQWVEAIEQLHEITYSDQGNKENKKANEF